MNEFEKMFATAKGMYPILHDVCDKLQKLHSFLFNKAYDLQDKYDRTLVYFSGGAIALTYPLIVDKTIHFRSWLLVAILLWSVSCVLALFRCVVHIRTTVECENLVGDSMVDMENRRNFCDTWLNIAEKMSAKPQNPSLAKDMIKEGELVEGMLKNITEIKRKLYTHSSSLFVGNMVQFGVFVIGLLSFAVYVVLQYCTTK